MPRTQGGERLPRLIERQMRSIGTASGGGIHAGRNASLRRYFMQHMAERVGVRELRQNLSRYLERVKDGEDLVVTERGREVARLVPAGTDAYVELAARFGATVPLEPLESIATRLAPPARPAGTTDAFLDENRADRLS